MDKDYLLIYNPSEQGLKQQDTPDGELVEDLLIYNPSEQGLKQQNHLKQWRRNMLLLIYNPSEQGLKRFFPHFNDRYFWVSSHL